MSLLQLNRIRSGLWIWGKAGENVVNRQLLYLSGDETWSLSDASAAGTMPARGVSMDTAATGEAIRVLTIGTIWDDAWVWTPGAALYASTVAGEFTETEPAAPNIGQRVGEAYRTNLVYFDPDSTDENATGGAGGFGGDPDFFRAQNPDGNTGTHAGESMVQSQDNTCRIEFLLPTDFDVSTWSVDAVIIPDGGGTMRYGVTTNFGLICANESKTANTDSIAQTDLAVTLNEIECINMIPALTGSTPNDMVGLEFTRYGSHVNDNITATIWFIGIVIRRP